jgi:hypothetical protein
MKCYKSRYSQTVNYIIVDILTHEFIIRELHVDSDYQHCLDLNSKLVVAPPVLVDEPLVDEGSERVEVVY